MNNHDHYDHYDHDANLDLPGTVEHQVGLPLLAATGKTLGAPYLGGRIEILIVIVILIVMIVILILIILIMMIAIVIVIMTRFVFIR